jgi:20S proteasome alpha/beta subunit
MTLVIYIPFSGGVMMISDRQNTYFEDLTREPIDKMVKLQNFNAILGFAGPTQRCRYLIDQLRRDDAVLSFEESYERIYGRCCGTPELGFRPDDVELLVLTHKTTGEGFTVHRILGAVMNEVDEKKCTAIGGGAKYIVPQLQLNTNEVSRDEAEEFGLTLLAYTSIIDISVGSPATYGYNIVSTEAETNQVLTHGPTNVDIEKLLYRFEE